MIYSQIKVSWLVLLALIGQYQCSLIYDDACEDIDMRPMDNIDMKKVCADTIKI